MNIETFEKLMEEIEDIYFGELAQAAFQHETEYIAHETVKKHCLDK